MENPKKLIKDYKKIKASEMKEKVKLYTISFKFEN